MTAKIADPDLRERVLALGRALERRTARVSKPAGLARKPV
jgi:hypothetical protein